VLLIAALMTDEECRDLHPAKSDHSRVECGEHVGLSSERRSPEGPSQKSITKTKKLSTMAQSREQWRREVMGYYADGRTTVQSVVEQFRLYPRHHYRHQMWDARFPFYIGDCFKYLSEAKMVELLQAVIRDTPDFPLLRSREDEKNCRRTFVYVALLRAWAKGHGGLDPNEGNTSFNVLRLLMVPGITRKSSASCDPTNGRTPLYQACDIPGLDPAVLHHLIDLDPGSLLRTSMDDLQLPLHAALRSWTPASSGVVRRMVELAPESLFRPNWGISASPGLAPVVFALCRRPLSPDLAQFLQRWVEQHPGAAQPGVVTAPGTALRIACQKAHQDAGLIGAILRTYPPALGSAMIRFSRRRELPYEVAAERNNPENGTPALELLRRETIEVALAVVESALQSTSTTIAFAMNTGAAARVTPARQEIALGAHSSAPDGSDDDPRKGDYYYQLDKDDHVTRVDKFRLRVRAAVSRAVLSTDSTAPTVEKWARMSGFAWAQALREHDRCLDVCRELFVCPVTSCLVLEDAAFRESVLGTTTMNLYRMNKAGGRASPSPHHQVRLLASLQGDLDGIYLQFREFGSVHLVPTGRTQRKRKAAGRQAPCSREEGRRWRRWAPPKGRS
jgi:hypothetical protein